LTRPEVWRFLPLVALTENELSQARKALGEIQWYRTRWVRFIPLGIFGLQSARVFYDHPWISWESSAAVLVLIAFVIIYWRFFQEVKRRYPANTEILRSLAAREGDSIYELDVAYPHYKPLFEAWNRRLEQRALLWRLDHFLSGKGWPSS